jgi:hypothetical protein
MRRSLAVRIATVALVVTMAVPAFAAPRRDDSPVGEIGRAISRIVRQVLDFANDITVPK